MSLYYEAKLQFINHFKTKMGENNVIYKILNRLTYLVNEIPIRINEFSESEMNNKPAPNKWSKKEILGHLIDSASNNHHRFVRVQFESQPFTIIEYKQNQWVSSQDYHNSPVENLINLWQSYNKHLIHVISKIPQEKLGYICNVDNEKQVSLLWLIEDYLSHMEHHLKQIFGSKLF
ncbi:MAG: DinB family protein [Ignavibacteria bacterium]